MTGKEPKGAPRKYHKRTAITISLELEDAEKARESEYTYSDIFTVGLKNLIPSGMSGLEFRANRLKREFEKLKTERDKLDEQMQNIQMEISGLGFQMEQLEKRGNEIKSKNVKMKQKV